MARRSVQSPPVKMTQWFDHVASDLVDVIPNAEGEFIQVWSASRGQPGRHLLLSYQRTPNGPCAIQSHVRLEGGVWSSVATTGPRRTFYYAGDTHDIRYEELLPSGRLLIVDNRAGLAVREVWAGGFDWDRQVPTGRPLGPRMVRTRQERGETFVVCSYQQEWVGAELQAERLACVAEYRGYEWIKVTEPTSVAPVGAVC